MNFKKLISLFLAVLMLCGALTSLSVITASAEEVTTAPPAGETEKDDEEGRTLKYHSTVFANPEEKLKTMKEMYKKGNYAIYADQKSGEVAVKDLATGQILFSNPYDIGTSNATENVKNRLMSQVIIQFKEVESANKRTYGSFEYAAAKDQVKIQNIKNGIRVEYTIGREEARMLVPCQIKKERFEEMILAPMQEYYGITRELAEQIRTDYEHPQYPQAFYLLKQLAYYSYEDLDLCESDRLKNDKLDAYPILAKMDIYVLDSTTSTNEKAKIEEVIKAACPNYSYEEMDRDHQETEYTSEEENPPLFKLALEYTLDGTGFTVRLPANGIRFNESKFELLDIQMLPYMGAGNNAYDGYAFFPDGSGALFAFEDMKEITNETITAKVYGEDYAYHKLDMEYQQVVRYPVYGIVEKTRYYDCRTIDDVTGEDVVTTISGVIYDAIQKAVEEGTTGTSALYKEYGKYVMQGEVTERVVNNGFAAMIEEGDALTSLSYIHEGTQADYDTIAMICNPRPRDEYNLADAISVGDNKTVSVVSERKYVSNYKVHYTILADEKEAADAVEAGTISAADRYEATWLGMAMAYRDHLVGKGILSAKTEVSSNIPLYIESFGAMETIEKILSVPVEVKRPLTSTEDILTMFDELSKEGVKNINFKLTGYANGGMYATAPYGLKWEKAATENVSMQELFDKAAGMEDGELGIFPDFDFSYVNTTELFDGFSMRKHAVRTIDDRNAFKREYMATQQRYAGYFYLAVSPAYYSRFYTKLMDKYLKHDNLTGISVGTLGNALNSDFDEDEPYNREDSKSFVTNALKFIRGEGDQQLEVMVDGGNAYTWQYVDHILGASLDSSRYIVASYSVPFLGVVLHGYKNFTGTPLNMEGDLNYAKLKAIENGASIYFTLSYQNTQNLKEDFYLNKYYSVRYDIWFDDVIEIYTELNSELADVQMMPIIDHEFLTGMRVPDTDELDRDLSEQFNEVMNFQSNQQAFLEQLEAESVADARKLIAALGDEVTTRISGALTRYRGNAGAAIKYLTTGTFTGRMSAYVSAKLAHDDVMADANATEEQKTAAAAAIETAKNNLNRCIRDIASSVSIIQTYYKEIDELMAAAEEGFALIDSTAGRPQTIVDEIKVMIEDAKASLDEQMGISFEYSTGNLELNTFLYLHYSYLSYIAGGDANHSGEKVVGTLQNIYEIFSKDAYGIYGEEADYLRYLSANRDLSIEEIKAKYGLKDGVASSEALIQYVLEILGGKYEFDPVINATDGVGNSISDYFKNKFMCELRDNNKKLTNEDVDTFLQYFNINPDRPHATRPGVMVGNNGSIIKLIKAVYKELNTHFTDRTNGVISLVTDGNYDLNTLYTEAQMNELVAKVKAIFDKYIAKEADAEYAIEYYTPETMESDIRNYIYAYYYYKVMDLTVPDDADEALLPVLTVESKTDSSLNLLLDNRFNSFGTIDKDTKYEVLAGKYVADKAYVDGILAEINDQIKPYYGDKAEQLEYAYLVAFAAKAIAGDKSTYSIDAADAEQRAELRERAKNLLAEKLPTISHFEGLDAIVDEVVALHADYEVKDDYDIEAKSAAYVYYNYFSLIGGKTNVETYYYDATMATVDNAILEKVAEKKAYLVEKLGDDFTAFEYYEAVMAILADKNDPVNDFVDTLAAKVAYVPEKKGTIADDILNQYCYLLFNCIEGVNMGKLDDIELTVEKGDPKTARSNIQKAMADVIDELFKIAKTKIAERGDMPNYAIESFMTEAEINVIVDDLIAKQLAKLDFVGKNPDYETLRPQVLNIMKFCFYEKVVQRLNATKPIDFNVYEMYNDSLLDSVNSLLGLVEYYTLNYTEITEEELDRLFRPSETVGKDDEEDEVSRYLSDDGRIVSVTYGKQNAAGGYDPYKTFILNYNNFSVNVEYGEGDEKVTYTIPAYDYVVVMHNQNP